jgi:murein L,D-transpeptidase YcbB/YkuD
VPAVAPLLAPAPVVTDSAVEAFYASRPGTLVWLRDTDTRAAAAKLAEILRRAPVAGLADGPALAAKVEAAIARSAAMGQPDDDKILSSAWVRYVRTIKGPVGGVSYGDPALKLKAPSADSILSDALTAPSLSAHFDQVTSVNPLYTALRDEAVKEGSASDPRVRATLDRLRLVPATGRAILVDVASARLWMLDNGQPIDSMKVVVGKTKSPTPLLAGTIHYVTFNPYWHILDDVARRKVAPIILKRGVSYLKAARYETLSDWTKPEPVDPSTIDWKAVAEGTEHVFIRQRPGVNNMMGAVKFSFENDYDIFLHDTPHKELFDKDQRTLSLGCIRLEHADRLAHWLLGRDAAPPSDAPELHVQIDKGVPVYITYMTAKVEEGQLAFAQDVYGLDPAPEPAPQVAAASIPAAQK